ncbi:putative ATPase [Linderina macrospora]|uniref:ATPase n=1 Tax=Linderina macrospora TaxID=4868 RepID=A0ACC1J9T6_9FUNG|nr:putative ATPase [Linderina macrospora]
MAMRDRLALQRFAWKYIIIDEGHRIKNMNCKLIRDLKMYQSANRLLLTGTPLQNSLAELWALLNFLLPEIFDDLDSFQAWFDFNDINEREGRDRIISEETQNSVVSKLHHILQPFLLRRLKSDVEKFLPPKREYLIACPMAPVQYEYYQAVRGPNLREFLQTRLASDQETTASVTPAESATATTEDDVDEEEEKGEKGEKREEEEAPPMRMRTRLTHQAEAVIDEDDDSLTLVPSGSSTPSQQKQQQQQRDVGLEQLRTKTMIKQMNLQFRLMQLRKVCQHPYLFDFPVTDPTDPESPYLIDEQLVRTSGKLIVLDRLLPELFKNGHRVLIFSQFSRVLDILDFYATMRNWRFCRIDGAVQQGDREQQIAEFNTNTGIPLSGGLGINLTAADTVVIFDSDWNPQQDLQAQDRVHRIGQTRPVIIYRLVVAGSCEGAILKRANSKRKLEKLVIHERKFKGLGRNNATGNTTRDETGAAAGTDKSKDELSVQDIAQILMADDTELVEKDQRELKDTLERLGPDDPVPGEAVLTQEELAALTDRSPAAYKPKAVVPSVLHQASRIEELVATRDETNDMLAKMEKL